MRIYVHHVHGWRPWRPDEDTRFSEARVIDTYMLPYGCHEPNLGPIEQVLSHLNNAIHLKNTL